MSDCAEDVAASRSWNAQQSAYWTHLTSSYDDLYRSRWSELENAWVSDRLGFLGASANPRVLDLGCGTGLGAKLVSRWAPLTGYLGVDISPAMTRHTSTRFGVETRTGPMDDVAWASDGSFDHVICLFSATSFVHDPVRLFGEVSRVLRPGGTAYLSALGRAWGRSPRQVRFRTRGHDGSASVPAWRFRRGDLTEMAVANGLRVDSLEPMNGLSGICELTALWPFGHLLARAVPSSSHLLEMTCTKPTEELP